MVIIIRRRAAGSGLVAAPALAPRDPARGSRPRRLRPCPGERGRGRGRGRLERGGVSRWAARATRSRSAPPALPALPALPMAGRRPASTSSSSRSSTKAVPASRASFVRRTPTARESGAHLRDPPSSTTRAKAPERRRTSAHHAPLAGASGRITQSGWCASADPATGAQSRGASVRSVSMTAAQSPRAIVVTTRCLTSVVFPLPRVPTISVSRPRGMPRAGRSASSAASPVASPAPSGRGAGAREASR